MPTPPAYFLATLPTGLPHTMQKAMIVETRDPRTGLIGLLAEAQEYLLLASPFWDEETMNDLGTILERRLHGGFTLICSFVPLPPSMKHSLSHRFWATLRSNPAVTSGPGMHRWPQITRNPDLPFQVHYCGSRETRLSRPGKFHPGKFSFAHGIRHSAGWRQRQYPLTAHHADAWDSAIMERIMCPW